MNPTVTVVDYGMGNLFSVSRAFELCAAHVTLTNSATGILAAERLVLPGVGAFKDGMAGLEQRRLVLPLQEYAASGRPLLGICLGMQMLLDSSEEFGLHKGLGVIAGCVVPIPAQGINGLPHKIPHIGWNALLTPSDSPQRWEETILKGTDPGDSVYFVHSYNALPENPRDRLADCCYGGVTITAAVRSGAVYGCQFHPEKSGKTGLKILSNFLNLGSGQRYATATLPS